ncbi:MAG: alanine racemase, partial [Hamadaea sp.]|nr:alanine racemase [Hamadaea sp.]
GRSGWRAGCRTHDEALAVARAIAAAPRLVLAGVAGFEGLAPTDDDAQAFLDDLRSVTIALADHDLVGGEVIVSAGGSAHFDLVTATLGGDWLPGRRLRTILRSGASVSHDDGMYRESTPFHRLPGEGTLDAALAVWAQVLSTPEPGYALVGMGKRDAPHDDLPIPLRIRRSDGRIEPADGLRVTRLNDQHGHLEVRPPTVLAPGDLIAFGISHPCLAFDKWPVIPVVEDDDTVTELLKTYF